MDRAPSSAFATLFPSFLRIYLPNLVFASQAGAAGSLGSNEVNPFDTSKSLSESGAEASAASAKN